jgi:hypothetical protein
MGEKKTFTCQNPACKRTFAAPLKTLNLQENPSEPYFACPICLTKIDELTPKKQEPVAPHVEPQRITVNQSTGKGGEKPGSCSYHLGYLAERAQKEQIPDDCLVCPRIVDCMLKRINE